MINELFHVYNNVSFCNNDGTLNMKTIPEYTTDYLKSKGFVLSNNVQEFEGITIYPSDYFNPKNYLTGKIETTDNTFSIHHYDASWWGEKEKKEYELERKIGKYCGRVGLAFFHAIKIYRQKGFRGLIKKIKE